MINKTEELINRIYAEESLKLFENYWIGHNYKDIQSEHILHILFTHHNENCDCSFYIQTHNICNFQQNSLKMHTREKMFEKEKKILYNKFKKWLHLIFFLLEEEFFLDSNSYTMISQIFYKIISFFVFPELCIIHDKGKTQNQQRFPPSLQTFMAIKNNQNLLKKGFLN